LWKSIQEKSKKDRPVLFVPTLFFVSSKTPKGEYIYPETAWIFGGVLRIELFRRTTIVDSMCGTSSLIVVCGGGGGAAREKKWECTRGDRGSASLNTLQKDILNRYPPQKRP
jgi:hypothetical protein